MSFIQCVFNLMRVGFIAIRKKDNGDNESMHCTLKHSTAWREGEKHPKKQIGATENISTGMNISIFGGVNWTNQLKGENDDAGDSKNCWNNGLEKLTYEECCTGFTGCPMSETWKSHPLITGGKMEGSCKDVGRWIDVTEWAYEYSSR